MLILAAGMIGAALSFSYFGWAGLGAYFLLIVACLFVAFRFGIRFAMWLTTRPMIRAGRVLHDAELMVHSLRPAEPPDHGPTLDEIRRDPELLTKFREDYEIYVGDLELHESAPTFDEWLEDEKREEARQDERLDWYDLELTISPSASQSQRRWAPGFLMVTSQDEDRSKVSFSGLFLDSGNIETVERWDEARQAYLPVDRDEYVEGAARLRLRLGLKRDVQRFKLSYHVVPMPGEISVPER